MGTRLTLDNVGRTYIGIAIAWSIILYGAMGVLWSHRRLPQLQMRRLPLVFAALTILHIYWTLCMIVYIIAPVIPCSVEYWIMSILLPLGIAMFQVANTQFLYVACGQRRFNGNTSLSHLLWKKRLPMLEDQTALLPKKFSRWLKKIDPITKMVIIMGFGMTIQVLGFTSLHLTSLTNEGCPWYTCFPAGQEISSQLWRHSCKSIRYRC